LDEVDNKKITEFKAGWFEHFEATMPELNKKLNDGDKLSDEDKEALKSELEGYTKSLEG
jgi:F0F1-type ATP synthase alpha subunit